MANCDYENKVNDDEIISALEVIARTRECTWGDCDGSQITATALDLINRQKTEIERLKKEVNLVSIQFQDLQERYEEAQTEVEQLKEEANKYQKLWCIAVDDIETAKAEAYKEFAERLKRSTVMACVGNKIYAVTTSKGVDNILKEMLGEE